MSIVRDIISGTFPGFFNKSRRKKPVHRLRLRSHGMFSNVNEVVEQVRLATENGYQFYIDWHRSCYKVQDRHEDPWSYYFEQPFGVLPVAGKKYKRLETGRPVACTTDNIITPRLQDGQCDPLLLPTNRLEASKLIERHILLNESTKHVLETFISNNFYKQMIGLHVRGRGKTDDGSARLRGLGSVDEPVDLKPYFTAVDTYLAELPEAGILVCSDSEEIISKTRKRFGERLVVYDATRTKFGEMHADHQENAGQRFDPHKLGLDVLIEAYALARCDTFVHGISNVANFVLCRAPDIRSTYVYEGIDPLLVESK